MTSVAVASNGTTALAGDKKGAVFLLDAKDRCAVARPLTFHTAEVRGVAIAPGAKLGVSVDASGGIAWWDLETGALIEAQDALRGRVKPRSGGKSK